MKTPDVASLIRAGLAIAVDPAECDQPVSEADFAMAKILTEFEAYPREKEFVGSMLIA
jgi:hypothetical protein